MMVPIASVILIWQVLFDNNGIVNEILARYDVTKIDWMKSDGALIVIIFLFVWKNLGYNMILFMAAIANIPKDLIEVAKLESASDWVIFRTIKIRYLASTILFVTHKFVQGIQGDISSYGRLPLRIAVYAAALHEQHVCGA